jgi:hypothetical protein
MRKKYINSGGGGSGRKGFSGFISTFLGLTDTPNTYTGQAAKVLQVNAGETEVEFVIGKGVANGFASLDGSGKLPTSQLPPLAISDYLGSVASQVAMLALVGENGDWCIRSDLGTSWVVINTPSSLLANWQQLAYPGTVAHSFGGGLHIADTVANIQGKVSDGSLLTSKPSEISAFANKAVPIAADLLLIEDSASANAKKNITIGSLPYTVQTAKINISHVDFQTAALTKTNTLFSLPAGAIVIGIRLKASAIFTGPAISNYFLSVGISGGTGDLMQEYDTKTITPGDQEYAESHVFQSFDYNNAFNLTVTGRSVGANLSTSTGGAAVVEVIYIPKA